MDKEWLDSVKAKIDSFDARRIEISTALSSLLNGLKVSPYNMNNVGSTLTDQQNLVWTVIIGNHKFMLSENEVSEYQQIKEYDGYGGMIIKEDEKREISDALQELILKKLKSF